MTGMHSSMHSESSKSGRKGRKQSSMMKPKQMTGIMKKNKVMSKFKVA